MGEQLELCRLCDGSLPEGCKPATRQCLQCKRPVCIWHSYPKYEGVMYTENYIGDICHVCMTPDDEIAAAHERLHIRLSMLAGITVEDMLTAENMQLSDRPQEYYHRIVEEAYNALRVIETAVGEMRVDEWIAYELRHALECEHQRLNEARDMALWESTHKRE